MWLKVYGHAFKPTAHAQRAGLAKLTSGIDIRVIQVYSNIYASGIDIRVIQVYSNIYASGIESRVK